MALKNTRVRKPRIVIARTGGILRPFIFLVRFPGTHWKNSQWYTFDEALVAAGVKSIDSLPSASDMYQDRLRQAAPR